MQTDELLAASADAIEESHRLLALLRRELITTNEYIEQTRKSLRASQSMIQLLDRNVVPYYSTRRER